MVKNRLVFVLLLLLSINFIYFYGGIVPYTLFYLMLLIPLMSFLYALILFKTCKCTQEISEMHVMKGETVSFSYSFNNRSILLNPYLKCNFSKTFYLIAELKEVMGFSLLPKKVLKKEFAFHCKYRGIYEVGIKEMYFEDLIGIIRFTIPINGQFQLTVMPALVKLEKLYFAKKTVDESETPSQIMSQQINEMSDIREFRTGDSLKKVHWKVSAKANQLMVKNFVNTMNSAVNILFDLTPLDIGLEHRLAVEDKMIEVLYAISHYYAERNYPVILTSYASQMVEIKFNSLTTFNKQCYPFLLQTNFESSMRNDELVDLFLRKAPLQSELFVLTCVLTPDLLERLQDTQLVGFDVKVIYIIPDDSGPTGKYAVRQEMLDAYENASVQVIQIAARAEIKQILEGA